MLHETDENASGQCPTCKSRSKELTDAAVCSESSKAVKYLRHVDRIGRFRNGQTVLLSVDRVYDSAPHGDEQVVRKRLSRRE